MGWGQSQSVWCTKTTPSTAWTCTRWRGRTVKGGMADGRWRSSVTSSTWLGSMPTSYSRSTSSKRARRKVLRQLTEELREEYIEGKGATAVGTMWAAAEPTTAAAADTDTDTEAVPNQTSDTWNATSPCVVTVRGEKEEISLWPVITTAFYFCFNKSSSFPAVSIFFQYNNN